MKILSKNLHLRKNIQKIDIKMNKITKKAIYSIESLII